MIRCPSLYIKRGFFFISFVLPSVLWLVAVVISLTQQNSYDVSTWTSNAPNLNEADPKPFSFSACLLVKDANVLLPEWLAYHYTRLPLRRLIVAVDPLSFTDPKQILSQFETIGMKITTWYNDTEYTGLDDGKFKWYWERHVNKKFRYGNPPRGCTMPYGLDIPLLHYKHKNRQCAFYSSCLRTLKEEGTRSWTILIDTDEYLAFNHYDDKEDEPGHCRGNTTCIQDFDQSIKRGTNIRTKLGQFKTVAEYIRRQNDYMFMEAEKPCVVLPRFLYPSLEFGDDLQLPTGFNTSDFHTLRFRHRGGFNLQLGKDIIDVSRMNKFKISQPHRINEECTGSNGWAHTSDKSFRINHYGTACW